MINDIAKLLKKKNFSFLSKNFKISFLANGAYNTIFLIKCDTGNFVFRINTYKDKCAGYGLNNEHIILDKIIQGLAPVPLHIDSTKKDIPFDYRIEKYSFGTIPKRITSKLIKKIARSMALLHNHEFEKWGEYPGNNTKYQLGHYLTDYFTNITWNSKVTDIISKAKLYIEKKSKVYPKLKRYSLIHNDIHLQNVLETKKKIFLIDWEYADIGDPATDIAIFFWFSRLFGYAKKEFSQRQRKIFFDEYFQYRFDPTLKDRVKISEPLVCLFESLWMIMQLRNIENIPNHIRTKERIETYKKGVVIGMKAYLRLI